MSPFLSLRGGLVEMVKALTDRLGGCRLMLRAGARRVSLEADALVVVLADGTRLRASGVILATPAFVTSELVASLDPDLAHSLSQIRFVSTASVTLAYPESALSRPLQGYGYLRPRAEGGPVTACTWVTSKWPGRAPPGTVILRAFIGRAGSEEVVGAPDGDLEQLARHELRETTGLTDSPLFVRIARWPRGMPQYTCGHLERLHAIRARLAELPGVYLAGHSYDGAGLSDCIDSGIEAAYRSAELALGSAV